MIFSFSVIFSGLFWVGLTWLWGGGRERTMGTKAQFPVRLNWNGEFGHQVPTQSLSTVPSPHIHASLRLEWHALDQFEPPVCTAVHAVIHKEKIR